MNKIFKCILIFILIITVLIGFAAIWQHDNILAIISGLTTSSEDIALQIDKERENLNQEIHKYTKSTINDISAEDEKKLLNGAITLEEVADKYNLPMEYIESDDEYIDISKGNTKVQVIVDNTQQIDEAISESVSIMYALKAKYVDKLGGLERSVLDQYKSLPKTMQNEESKKEIVMDNIEYVASLEKSCDTEVDKVLSSLKEQLINLGGDTEIVKTLEDAYYDEKELRKSYYLSIYND
jgi:hypothetical protein